MKNPGPEALILNQKPSKTAQISFFFKGFRAEFDEVIANIDLTDLSFLSNCGPAGIRLEVFFTRS
jgi:hypothetical protein